MKGGNEPNISKRILLVDDEEKMIFVWRKSLEKLGKGYEIVTAQSGYEALDKLQEGHFDLVITDIMMPGMDGMELTESIQSSSPDTKIIWVTAHGNRSIESELQRLGVQTYLSKPVDINEFRRIAREALEVVRSKEMEIPSNRSSEPVGTRLDQLRMETRAECILLISVDGQIVDLTGDSEGVDVTTLSAITAGNFLAAQEIARLLGQQNTFRLSYHESDRYKVYTYGVGKNHLLVTVFGQDIKPGVVWLYTRRAADELAEMLSKEIPDERIKKVLNSDFEKDLERQLSDLDN